MSGGSIASLVCLGVARPRAFERVGRDPARDGVATGGRVYASSQVHHVVTRAAAVLGLGRHSVTSIEVDDRWCIRVDALRERLARDRRAGVLPVAIVATAGAVNTGAVDPIGELVDLAAEFGTWLHVDGAYGLSGRLDERLAPRFEGLDRADSFAVDPHGWLAAPVGCGAAFVRDRGLLGRAFTLETASTSRARRARRAARSNPRSTISGRCSTSSRWSSPPPLAACSSGRCRARSGSRACARVRRHVDLARRLADRVRGDERLELLAEPELSICCFRHRGPGLGGPGLDALNQELLRGLWIETDPVPSSTRIGGAFAIRACFINPRVTEVEVDRLAAAVRGIGDRPLTL